MIKFPNCKINLGLSITEKRSDGFHNIESVLYPVNHCEALEVIESTKGQFSFTQSGIKIPGNPENNLLIKTYQILKEAYQLPEVHIHLHKTIPMGAGLGGGSSDAAFMILLLNDLFKLNLTQKAMEEFARQIGSDCAFFISNKPAFAFEKGDHFKPFSIDLRGYYLTIVKPEIHISTPDAYSWVKPMKKEKPLMELINQPIHTWKVSLTNDFEKEICIRYPEIESIKNKLYNSGALYASMSGSGSAVFAISEKELNLPDDFSSHFIWQEKIK